MPAAWSGCSVAWLARCTGGAEVASSNLAIPTIFFLTFPHFLHLFPWNRVHFFSEGSSK